MFDLGAIWLIVLRASLPAVIAAIKMHLGKEVVEAMQAGIKYAGTLGVGGKEAETAAWAEFIKEVKDVPTAGAELVRQGLISGVPWFVNVLFSTLIGSYKVDAIFAGEKVVPALPEVPRQEKK